MRSILLIAAAAALFASPVLADDQQPTYAPDPAWVRAVSAPSAPAPADDAPAQILLLDRQTRLSDTGDDHYQHEVIKILSPEGLGASGQLAQTWDPSTESLTIHHLRVIHDGQVRDILASGQKFLVLRRENNLELAMLDGRLTATIQPEGLEVGDIIDFAMTVTRHDPALQGHSVNYAALDYPGVAGRVFLRTIWPNAKPVQMRATVGEPAPTLVKAAAGTEAVLDLTNAAAPKPPIGAPPRFQQVATEEFSEFKDWSQVSALMAPLYERAEVIKPGSALSAEVAKIAASTQDPKARATAALRLVEDQTRYVFLGMNDGGLVPAAAEETWARRFGDCKGKSVLLVASLRALGLNATPVAVSTQMGDGMDQRLPNVGWFDHAIVLLVIDGRTYWLDGTRQGDLEIGDLITPNYHWGLAVKAQGGGLVAMEPPPPAAPLLETRIHLDASKGMSDKAAAHVDVIFRSDAAMGMRHQLAAASRTDFERNLRDYMSKTYPWLTIDTVGVARDDARNEVRLYGDGSAQLQWTPLADGRSYNYSATGSSMSNDNVYRRQPGPNQDAPYATSYPSYVRVLFELVLPSGGQYTLAGTDVDQAIGGQYFKRISRITDGVLSIDVAVKSMLQEFPASAADQVNTQLRALPRGEVLVNFRPRTAAAAADPIANWRYADAQAKAEAGNAEAEFRLGVLYERGQGVPYDATLGLLWLQRAAQQGYAKAELAVGEAYMKGVGVQRSPVDANAWFAKAAQQGEAEGQYQLAIAALTGSGMARNPAQGTDLLNKAADAGFMPATSMLGQMSYFGFYAPRDLERGRALLQKAADAGYAPAQRLMGDDALIATDRPHDFAKGVAWEQKAVAQGDRDAENSMGVVYRDGLGVPRSTAQAMDWFQKSAAHGAPAAMVNIGELYATGDGVSRDMAQALVWCRKAADLGYAAGERCVGLCYLQGRGVAADAKQAQVWLLKAAGQGDPIAIRSLAGMGALKLAPIPPAPAQTPPRT